MKYKTHIREMWGSYFFYRWGWSGISREDLWSWTGKTWKEQRRTNKEKRLLTYSSRYSIASFLLPHCCVSLFTRILVLFLPRPSIHLSFLIFSIKIRAYRESTERLHKRWMILLSLSFYLRHRIDWFIWELDLSSLYFVLTLNPFILQAAGSLKLKLKTKF